MSSMMNALSNWLVNPRRNPLARLHMHTVSSRLRKYGNPGSETALILCRVPFGFRRFPSCSFHLTGGAFWVCCVRACDPVIRSNRAEVR
jgi:hypothetical protein